MLIYKEKKKKKITCKQLGKVEWERRQRRRCLAEWMMSGRRVIAPLKAVSKTGRARVQKNQVCCYGGSWIYPLVQMQLLPMAPSTSYTDH